MKIIIFEDEKEMLGTIENVVINTIKINSLNLDLALATQDEEQVRDILTLLQEPAIFLIDIVKETDSNAVGLSLIREIAKEKILHKVIVITQYPQKVLFQPEIKFYVNSIIFKRLPNRSIAESLGNLERELAVVLRLLDKNKNQIPQEELLSVTKRLNSTFRVPMNEITFIETYPKNRILIHYDKGECVTRMSLKEVAAQLNQSFMRCYISYIVNVKKIRKIEGYKIIFDNGLYCYYSEKYQKDLKTLMNLK